MYVLYCNVTPSNNLFIYNLNKYIQNYRSKRQQWVWGLSFSLSLLLFSLSSPFSFLSHHHHHHHLILMSCSSSSKTQKAAISLRGVGFSTPPQIQCTMRRRVLSWLPDSTARSKEEPTKCTFTIHGSQPTVIFPGIFYIIINLFTANYILFYCNLRALVRDMDIIVLWVNNNSWVS